MKLTRSEALQLCTQILLQAEKERSEIAEHEALRGIRYDK